MYSFPIILLPRKFEEILAATPPLPAKPVISPSPVLPVKPQPPEKPEIKVPKQPRDQFEKIGWFASAGIAALTLVTGPLGLLTAGGIVAYGVYDVTVGYEQRQKDYNQKLKEYNLEMAAWWQKFQEWEVNKEQLIKEWENKKNNVLAQWEKEKQLLFYRHTQKCTEFLQSTYIDKWRNEQLAKAVVNPSIGDSQAPSGRLDKTLFNSLKSYFPELDIQQKIGLCYNHCGGMYTPDVTVHDQVTNIWIDVEIDEPWWNKSGQRIPSHFIGKDDNRNNFFTEQNNWIVIRFAEQQVDKNISGCVKVVATVLDIFRTQNKLSSKKIAQFSDLSEIPQWTEYEAVTIHRNLGIVSAINSPEILDDIM